MATLDATEQANRSAMDPRRLVVTFYLAAGLIFAVFAAHVLGLVWAQAGWRDPEVIEGLDWRVPTLLGVGLSIIAVAVCFIEPRMNQLSMEVASELMKVTWPSWEETRMSTAAVVIASLVAAMLLFGIDTMAYKMMVDWLPSLWGKF